GRVQGWEDDHRGGPAKGEGRETDEGRDQVEEEDQVFLLRRRSDRGNADRRLCHPRVVLGGIEGHGSWLAPRSEELIPGSNRVGQESISPEHVSCNEPLAVNLVPLPPRRQGPQQNEPTPNFNKQR